MTESVKVGEYIFTYEEELGGNGYYWCDDVNGLGLMLILPPNEEHNDWVFNIEDVGDLAHSSELSDSFIDDITSEIDRYINYIIDSNKGKSTRKGRNMRKSVDEGRELFDEMLGSYGETFEECLCYLIECICQDGSNSDFTIKDAVLAYCGDEDDNPNRESDCANMCEYIESMGVSVNQNACEWDDNMYKAKKGKNMKTKKSLLEDGDHKYLGGMSNGDTVDVEVDGFTFTIKCEVDYEGDSVYIVYETFNDGISDEICDVDDGMSVSEIKDTIRANADWDDIQRSARKSRAKSVKKEEKEIPIKDDDVVEVEEKDGEKVVEVESKEDHEKEVESGEEKESDNLNEGTKKSKVKKGADEIEWMIERCDGTETDVDVYLGQVEDVYDELISEIESDVESEYGDVIITDEVRVIGPEIEELKDTIYNYLHNLKSKLEDLRGKTASAKKSINKKDISEGTMRNMKKSALIKELEDLDEEECEGKDCEDKKEDIVNRSARKDEEPEKEPLTDESVESGDKIRERCKSTRKGKDMNARKGIKKEESAEPKETIVNEVADPEQLTSENKESATPKETVVDEVADPEERDDETHGAEPEETVVDENADPEEIDKLRRAKIRRALAKRRMQKARQSTPKYRDASVRKSPKQVRKFSVATRGSERYNGRENYNQSPMMREAIDRQFPKEDETVKALNARLDAIRSQSRNKVTNPIGKKRLH